MKVDINQVLSAARNSIYEIRAIYAEKGMEPFKKPLMMALPIFLVVYFGFYAPSGSKLSQAKDELARYELIAPFYDDYVNYKNSAAQYKKKLPLYKDKAEWLDYIIRSSSQKNAITPETIGAQTESEISGGFLLASRSVSIRADYQTIGKLIADIENSPIFVKVTELNLKKDAQLGVVLAEFKVATVFIKPGG